MLRPANGGCRVSRNDVSDHEPVKQHPHRSQVLLDSWFCLASLRVLDIAGAEHAFTTGKIGQTSFEKPLRPSSEKIGMMNGFGCFPDKVAPEKNTGTFIPGDFEHEIATNFLLKGKGLVVLTSCSHRGVINTIRQAQTASGISKVHAVIGGFHIVRPLSDDYIHQVIAALKEIGPDYLVLAHCCGERFYDLARAELPDKVIHSAVGTRFVFGT